MTNTNVHASTNNPVAAAATDASGVGSDASRFWQFVVRDSPSPLQQKANRLEVTQFVMTQYESIP
jgi:hypothetical protein